MIARVEQAPPAGWSLENEGILALKRDKVLVRDVIALSKQLR